MSDLPVQAFHVTQMDLPSNQAVSFKVDAFDGAIRSQGVRLVHFRAMRCPVGLGDIYDTRRPTHDHAGCSNGMVYTEAGEVTATFMGSGNADKLLDTGLADGSSAQVTMPRHYDGTETEISIARFDRIYLAEQVVLVPTWQLFEATMVGREKLKYPVEVVEDLMDAAGRKYQVDADFVVEGGFIVWVGDRRPTYDPSLSKGQVCAVRYLYRPFWYVKQLLHEVRVAQAENAQNIRKVHNMHKSMVLQREYLFESENTEDPALQTARQAPSPADGSFFVR